MTRIHAVRWGVACSTTIAVLALSGCGFFGPKGNTPPVNSTETKQVPAAVDKVKSALKELADKGTLPSSQQFFDTMVKAGYPAKSLEATIDKSPLDHDVPSKMFGVKVKEGCVVGEIRDGAVSANLVPPLSSDGSCLMGDVERPKGVATPKGEQRKEGDKDNGVGHLPGDDLNGPGATSTPSPTSKPSRTRDTSDEDSGGGSLGGN